MSIVTSLHSHAALSRVCREVLASWCRHYGPAGFSRVTIAHRVQGQCQLLLADVLDNRHILGEWPLKDVKHGR